MSKEMNLKNNERITNDVINGGKLNVIDELVSPNYVAHIPGMGDIRGAQGLKDYFSMYRKAFPDVHMINDEVIAEGDTVTTRFTMTGTNTGEMMGMAATGKKVTTSGIVIAHFMNGKQTEVWQCIDSLGMMQQLGVVPKMEMAKMGV